MSGIRARIAIWLLKPWLRDEYRRWSAEIDTEPDHDSRHGGYVQGRFSAINALLRRGGVR